MDLASAPALLPDFVQVKVRASVPALFQALVLALVLALVRTLVSALVRTLVQALVWALVEALVRARLGPGLLPGNSFGLVSASVPALGQDSTIFCIFHSTLDCMSNGYSRNAYVFTTQTTAN